MGSSICHILQDCLRLRMCTSFVFDFYETPTNDKSCHSSSFFCCLGGTPTVTIAKISICVLSSHYAGISTQLLKEQYTQCPSSFLILHGYQVLIMWSQTVRQKKTQHNKRKIRGKVNEMQTNGVQEHSNPRESMRNKTKRQ